MTRDPEGYLNARKAAAYVGYEPNGGPARHDNELKAFYAFVRRYRVETKRRGRGPRAPLLFKRESLDRAIEACSQASRTPLEEMEELARRHARGETVAAERGTRTQQRPGAEV
jgi:hypothetical protein